MAAGDERRDDFYKVMGLKKECSSEDLRTAYKKLAMKWHPDRCYASSTDLEHMEKVKNKFQSIQEAYSVLSDTNKRFLYDIGVYDNNDDDDADENGMGDFLGEMADMMRQTESTETGSFEELQDLFNDMFQDDMNGSSTSYGGHSNFPFSSSSNFFSTPFTYSNAGQNLKRDNADITSGRRATAATASFATHSAFSYQFSSPEQTFCFGMSNSGSSSSNVTGSGGGGNRRKNGRKQKVSSRDDMSSRDSGISAN